MHPAMLLLNACWVLVLATLANAARDLPTIPLGIPLPSQSPFNPEYHIASPQMEVREICLLAFFSGMPCMSGVLVHCTLLLF
eukprot:1158979-Pelagomonas_calceolata.AAC.7